MKERLEYLENQLFLLEMKDHLTMNDYQRQWAMINEIRELKEVLKGE